MKVDWETSWWMILSMVTLAAVISFFWVFRLWEDDILPGGWEAGTVSEEAATIEINLEEAQVSKLSPTGREWEFATRSLRKRDEQLVLDEVTGSLFRDDVPLYQVAAASGWVDLDTQDVELDTVFMSSEKERETITGTSFEWKGDQHLFFIRDFSFESADARIKADQAWYHVQTGKINLADNVEIRMKLGD